VCASGEFYSGLENFLKGRATKNYEQPNRVETSVNFVNNPYLSLSSIAQTVIWVKKKNFANKYLLKRG